MLLHQVLRQMTALGAIEVPLFAYRDADAGACARGGVPAAPGLPFRQAKASLEFFTHSAAPVEDTPIARLLVAVGGLLDPTWTLQSSDTIRNILAKHATRSPDGRCCTPRPTPALCVATPTRPGRPPGR